MSASMASKITQLLTPIIEAQGVTLYDLEFIKEGGEKILRLYIDKPEGGVDINDCERVSRAAEAELDAHDPIPTAYDLEVSSPGVERKLTKPEHYTRYTGHKIAIKLYAPVDGTRKFTGILTSYENGNLSLTNEDGETRSFEQPQISACRLVVFE